MGDDMYTIGEKIKYLPAANEPLSADVYCIEGDKYCYVYDERNGLLIVDEGITSALPDFPMLMYAMCCR